MSDTDYEKYRGKCLEFCEPMAAADPTLTLVRGFYVCPFEGKMQHWWLKKEDGTIVDPTVRQFTSKGVGCEYIEFDGYIECEQCGKRVHEDEACIDGHHAFCSNRCYGRCVGW